MEQWKIVESNPKYEVSDCGRVRNKKTHRILKPQVNRTCKAGYLTVSLSNGFRNRKSFFIHRIVAHAFIGARPKGLECCHNDGNSRNNHIENIRYDTHKNNGADSIKHGVMPHGERHHDAKLTEQNVREIRFKHLPRKYTREMLAQEYGVSYSTIHHILGGRTWKYLDRIDDNSLTKR